MGRARERLSVHACVAFPLTLFLNIPEAAVPAPHEVRGDGGCGHEARARMHQLRIVEQLRREELRPRARAVNIRQTRTPPPPGHIYLFMAPPSSRLFALVAIVGAAADELKVTQYDGPTECEDVDRVKKGDMVRRHSCFLNLTCHCAQMLVCNS